MRTLQEKYNGINEGKFTKDQFLRDARMEQPNLVTKFNGYDDAVKILKNRGMIREAYSTEESFKDYSDDALADMMINLSRYEDADTDRVEKEIARRKEAVKEEVDTKNLKNVKLKNGKIYRNVRFHLPNDPKSFVTSDGGYMINQDIANVVHADQEIKETVKEDYSKILELPDGNYFAIDGDWEDEYQGNKGLFFTIQGYNIYDKNGESIQSSPREFLSQFKPEEILTVENLNEARLTNKSLTDYRYKPTNDMDKYPYEQILRGLRVELEGLNILGTPTPEEYTKALGKVLKNLEKDTIYYTNKIAGVSKKVDLHDKMVDVTAKNSVDTFNGLKKAQLKEAIKGVIKNILSEGNEFGEGEGVYEMYGDSDGDYEYDKEVGAEAEMLYDKGKRFATAGEPAKGEALRQAAIKKGSWLGWGVEDFPPYEEADDIPHPLGYEDQDEIDYDDENFSDPFIDGDLDEQKSEKELRAEWEKHQATCHPEDRMSYMEWRSEQGLDEAIDTEADKNMVRKFMAMYETEPSKFEKLHKQAQTQAATTKDVKFKHLLSLFNRAKAGALQSLSNQDRYQAGIEGMDESISLKDIL